MAKLTYRQIENALRKHALTYPESHEDFPWGERVVKVKGKVFVFMGKHEGEFHITVKLPKSAELARDLGVGEPTGYGLGKHGWISVTIHPGPKPPFDLLRSWIDESYRAVAPRKLVDSLAASKPSAPAGTRDRVGSRRRP
jgi:predicted DNA-binding protein (MmcQ/YjbR family)